jgi:membrane-associated phospholipid phosphatase
MTDVDAASGLQGRFYDPRLLPPTRQGTGRRWAPRLGCWLAVLCLFAASLHYDIALMTWRWWIFPEGPNPGGLRQILYGFRDFGQVLPIVVAIVIVLRCDTRRWTIVACILIAQLLAGIGYNTAKLLVARNRPNAIIEKVQDFASLTHEQTGLHWSPVARDEMQRSFPSGHSAAAFAFAGVLAWFYPKLRRLFWFLACGCAMSRYLDAVHWVSDCWAGATIGYVGAWLALRPSSWASPFVLFRRCCGCRQRPTLNL